MPSKYETVFSETAPLKNKGFGSNALRFVSELQEDPGPGHYESQTALSSMNVKSASYSKKGFGNGFISKVQRFGEHHLPLAVMAAIPGPGSYSSSSIDAMSSKKYQRTAVSSFKSIKRTGIENKKEKVPGPGTYEVLDAKRKELQGLPSAFKSKTSKIS